MTYVTFFPTSVVAFIIFICRHIFDECTRSSTDGFDAVMLPGISAEDCLFADLGIDPGMIGCQSFEATDSITFLLT
jgi:hypothetical protein